MEIPKNFEQNIEQSDKYYGNLQQEIADLKNTELAKKERGKRYDANLELVNPNSLTREDLDIWQKFKDETLTQEKISEYQLSFRKEEIRDPRVNFMAWLDNEFVRRELENKVKQKQAKKYAAKERRVGLSS